MGFLIESKRINTYFADLNDPWEYTWVEFGGLHSMEIPWKVPVFPPDRIFLFPKPRRPAIFWEGLSFFTLANHAQESSLHQIGPSLSDHGRPDRRFLPANLLFRESRLAWNFYTKEATTFVA